MPKPHRRQARGGSGPPNCWNARARGGQTDVCKCYPPPWERSPPALVDNQNRITNTITFTVES